MYKKVEDIQPITDYVEFNNDTQMVVNVVLMQDIVELAVYSKRRRHHGAYCFPYGVLVKCHNNPHT